jgi:hypothetical protein
MALKHPDLIKRLAASLEKSASLEQDPDRKELQLAHARRFRALSKLQGKEEAGEGPGVSRGEGSDHRGADEGSADVARLVGH